jgi:hypothetical protein
LHFSLFLVHVPLVSCCAFDPADQQSRVTAPTVTEFCLLVEARRAPQLLSQCRLIFFSKLLIVERRKTGGNNLEDKIRDQKRERVAKPIHIQNEIKN